MITIQNPDRLKSVIVSVIFAEDIPLGIPNCNENHGGFQEEVLRLWGINLAKD